MAETTLFVSPRRAWEITGLPRDEIYRRIHAGELPALRLNGRFKVPVRALEQLVEEVCEQAPDGPRPAA